MHPDDNDPVLDALRQLEEVIKTSAERNEGALESARLIRRLRKKGQSYGEIVPKEPRPLIVEALTQSLQELAEASARFRKAEARALYEEGHTMAEIATLFGVTRQRVATLLSADVRKQGKGPFAR